MAYLQKIAGLALLAPVLLLGGCGRRGAPELPPSAYTQDDSGRQVKKPPADKPFILDKLIK